MAPPKHQPQGRMRIHPRGSHANFQPNKFKYGTSSWEHTGVLPYGLLINYRYKSKIQKSDQITGCALASNPSIPSFVFQTPKFTPCYPYDKRVRQSPPYIFQRKRSIRRSSLRALTSLSQLRCDKNAFILGCTSNKIISMYPIFRNVDTSWLYGFLLCWLRNYFNFFFIAAKLR